MLLHGGSLCRMCRETVGYTQERAAEYLDVSLRSLAAYEAGERVAPDEVLAGMAELYESPLLVYQYLKETSPLGEYLPDVNVLQTNGDMGFSLVQAKERLDTAYAATIDIFADDRVTKCEEPEWRASVLREMEKIVEIMLSAYIYAGQVEIEDESAVPMPMREGA